jgi:S1-C subfamily serine protease
LIAFAAAFAVSGYRQGLIVGLLSFAGFIGGAVIGAVFAPALARRVVSVQSQQDLIAVILLVVAALLGQFLASAVGVAMRSRVTWRSATLVDAVGGAVVSVLSVLLIAWVIGSAFANSPFPTVSQQVNGSSVLRTVDRLIPHPARNMFSDFRRLLASGPFPQVFSGLGAQGILSVPAPNNSVLNSAGLRNARGSIVKILGTAPSCSRQIEGSGFVYAPDHVITNAHVVAGVTDGPHVFPVDDQSGSGIQAQVVLYDPEVDIAVLYVPGLNLTPLNFAGQAQSGSDAVVAGYPLNHPFTPVAARIGGIQDATGQDIYQANQVTRQIYAIRAIVEPGNSGGPLLAPNGSVYGVVFAAAVGANQTGYALTASQVAMDAQNGQNGTTPVSTQGCD